MVEVSGTLAPARGSYHTLHQPGATALRHRRQDAAAVRGYAGSLRRTYPGIQIERFWRW